MLRLHIIVPFVIALVLSSCSSSQTSTGQAKQANKSEITIAFGSCNRPDEEQTVWNKITKNKPDLWIWLGDIVYGDTEDMAKLRSDYDLQSANADYASFSSTRDVIGIWDDHDYGVNNGGTEYPKKDSSKLELFRFLNVSKDNPAWGRDGAYQSHLYTYGDLTVKVLLLDARYFREEPHQSNSTILGQRQWQWLIGHLSQNEADVHIIASGIQVLPTDHKYEKWGNFKPERERLLNIIDQLDVNTPIFISGDRHIGEMSMVALPQSGLPILEITSSGLTHYYESFTEEKNTKRYGAPVADINFGLLSIEKNAGEINYYAEIKNGDNKSVLGINSADLAEELLDIQTASVGQ
ncbi:MAG: alkaline phosphatase D family protein [Bacteroidota bacterium]